MKRKNELLQQTNKKILETIKALKEQIARLTSETLTKEADKNSAGMNGRPLTMIYSSRSTAIIKIC